MLLTACELLSFSMTAYGTSIRRASADDLSAMIGVQMRSVALGYPDEVRALLVSNPEIISEEVRRRWSAGDQFLVAQREERLVGFAAATVQANTNHAELVALFVDPDLWRQGIGRALVDSMAGVLSALGVGQLCVVANPLVEGFYRAAGFVSVGVVRMENFGTAPKYRRTIAPTP